jgi:hypothetical protein
MAHTLNGVTLYVTRDVHLNPAIVAELEVLDSTSTIVQHFSKPSTRRRLTAYVVGSTNWGNIEDLSSGSAAVNYTSDLGSQGNYYIKTVEGDRVRGFPMGFGGAASTDPVYLCNIDMIEA